MTPSPSALKTLLAKGQLETALAHLVRLTAHTDDRDLRQRVLNLSGQFATLKNQHLTGILPDEAYRLQWNRIAAAVTDIVDSEAITSSPLLPPSSFNWKKWTAIAVTTIGVLAGIAELSGWSLRDLWRKPEPAPVEKPVVEPVKKDTMVVANPAVRQPAVQPATGKNNVHIEVKDKAKVGTIITSDSNKIEVKQDF